MGKSKTQEQKKTSIQGFAPQDGEPAPTSLVTLLSLALIAAFVLAVLSKAHPRGKPFSGSRLGFRRGQATDKQMKYLAALVSKQNFFRSKELTFEDWFRRNSSKGVMNRKAASGWISRLRAQNRDLKSNFDLKKTHPDLGKFRGQIYVSDLHSFQFCERAGFYASHQFPSQNLIDLEQGKQIHESFAKKNRDHTKFSQISAFILSQEPGASRVEWLQNNAENSLRHSSLPLSGRPDGFVYYSAGSIAVIELKTVDELPVEPRNSDFDQAEVYSLLASNEKNMRGDCFVLYRKRSTRELALHKRARRLTEYDLAERVAKITQGARSKHQLRIANSVAQCRSCGYRAICESRLQ